MMWADILLTINTELQGIQARAITVDRYITGENFRLIQDNARSHTAKVA